MATTHEVTVSGAAPENGPPRLERTSAEQPVADRRQPRLRDINRTWPLTWGDGGKFLLAYAVMSGVWIAMGMAITHGLRHSWLQRTDVRIEVWFSQHRTHTFNNLTYVGSQLADTVVKIAATALIALVMLLVWKRWKEPLFVVAALILEAAVFITTTWTVGRPRPDVPRLETSPVGSSFPSGHTAAAVVYSTVVVIVFWHTKKWWPRVLAVCVVTLLVVGAGLSRMYRGMHHLSDVVAGTLLGLVAVMVTYAIVTHAERRRLARERQDGTHALSSGDPVAADRAEATVQ
jgi:undecaprenyl-diphosphatase